jgi:hypothetical protein
MTRIKLNYSDESLNYIYASIKVDSELIELYAVLP